jgi:hypothetical protein
MIRDAEDIGFVIEELIRTVPNIDARWGAAEHFEWLAGTMAVLSLQEVGLATEVASLARQCLSNKLSDTAKQQLLVLLHRAKIYARMRGPVHRASRT